MPILSAPRALCAALIVCAAGPAAAQADPTATFGARFSPDRAGASTALTLTLRLAGGAYGVPEPLTKAVVHLPAGLGINLRGVGTCSKSKLLAHGPKACPPSSRVGSGSSLLGAHLGSQTITESATLSAFRGPNKGGRPTLAISGQGLTPLDVRVVIVGVLAPDHAPYGSQLVMSIPTIPTLPTEPNASTLKFSLTIGGGHTHKTIAVPHGCPTGGFPFGGDFAFADGSAVEASAAVSCP